MKHFKKLKLIIYRILYTKLGSKFLKFLSFGVNVDNLKRKYNKKNKNLMPFIVVISIDSESGYVDSNEERIWQRERPEAFIGFYKGISNWRSLFNKYGVKGTFLVSTQCFDAKGRELVDIKRQLELLVEEKHEIGLHMHPDSDFAIQKKLSKSFNHTSAKFYDYMTKKRILRTSKSILLSHVKGLKNKLFSFRWGNWALDTGSVNILQELKFKVDSSATPGIRGHSYDHMCYDWSNVKTQSPWFLSRGNYKDTKAQDSSLLEIPIATFNFFGVRLRADPVNLVLLDKAFDFYYENAPRDKKPFIFVVISHSSEATHIDGSTTKVVGTMEKFIQHSKNFKDVQFTTLIEASGYFLRAKTK
jgi:peptidoglycan/xylan/chitin deacetylase (PgdA/CDA1 family)